MNCQTIISFQDGVEIYFDLVGTLKEHHYTHDVEQSAKSTRIVHAKLLIGADGIRSMVRRILAGQAAVGKTCLIIPHFVQSHSSLEGQRLSL